MWVMLLLLVFLYLGAVILVGVVGKERDQFYPSKVDGWKKIIDNFHAEVYFGTVPEAMSSLFNLVLMSEFSEFGRPIFLQQPIVWPIFVITVFIATWGLLNMLIGVVCDNT